MNFQTIKEAYVQNAEDKKQISQKTLCFMVAAFLAVFLLVAPEMAYAEPWDNVTQRVVDIFNGGLARTIAIIAIIACGVMALVGKLSWQWVVYIVIGLCLIFGAAAIVDFFISAAGGS